MKKLYFPLATLQIPAKNAFKTIIVTASLLLLTACITDRRTAGTILDNKTAEASAAYTIRKIQNTKAAHVNVTVYNTRILITGEVPTQEVGLEIENELRTLPKIDKVFNELIVTPAASFASRSNDTLITSKVKTTLLTILNPEHIKVVTERGNVYLMGIVTRKEADDVVNISQRVTGVKEVLSFFEYFTPEKQDTPKTAKPPKSRQ